ncbi:hypothetical protein CWI36_0544p0030 [Hamiltosporidium magnivora]|uniref:Uncharacterized protein n=1 Tax=Hamiltosporidium magnivora TaxID=148818 RepID=A0A4Q9LEQ4_9MICR|nr:hypothetical protein CWI36_0544p0030 [Hamiltosporidium magnivora]
MHKGLRILMKEGEEKYKFVRGIRKVDFKGEEIKERRDRRDRRDRRYRRDRRDRRDKRDEKYNLAF